jgi:hypothetical protein
MQYGPEQVLQNVRALLTVVFDGRHVYITETITAWLYSTGINLILDEKVYQRTLFLFIIKWESKRTRYEKWHAFIFKSS